jgi:hypothetical protein
MLIWGYGMCNKDVITTIWFRNSGHVLLHLFVQKDTSDSAGLTRLEDWRPTYTVGQGADLPYGNSEDTQPPTMSLICDYAYLQESEGDKVSPPRTVIRGN